jgi:pyrroline-5-carboxylate reductase
MLKNKNIFKATIGFIGAGGIASALVSGFCGAEDFRGKINLYNPSPEKALLLKKLYPDKVSVSGSNQELLDRSEVIFPAVVPGVLRQIAGDLKFRSVSRVVHIAAGIKLAETESWYAPAESVVRAVPLPFSSRRIGPIVFWGDDTEIQDLLSLVGSVIRVSSERSLEVLAAVTGMMAPYFALVGETVKWGMSKGVDFKSILDYATSMNEALSVLMRDECTEDIEAFLKKNITPGGMNELGLKILSDGKVRQSWEKALEQIGKCYEL